MPNPTRQEILTAHEALETLCARAPEDTPVYAMKSLILAALPPKPQPTMAEIEWDDDKHYLAEVKVGETNLVMLQTDLYGWIRCFDPKSGEVMPEIEPEDATPTGKRYTLTEVQE